ncbi:MAG: hypothetical protein V3S48_07930 [Candidatus Neomarinimicrobiota bacterium]
MDRITLLIVSNGLFILGSILLLWSLKRWLERRTWSSSKDSRDRQKKSFEND